MNKVCVDCSQTFPYTKEYFYSKGIKKLSSRCKQCDHIRRKNRRDRQYYNKRELNRLNSLLIIKSCSQCKRIFPITEKYFNYRDKENNKFHHKCKECSNVNFEFNPKPITHKICPICNIEYPYEEKYFFVKTKESLKCKPCFTKYAKKIKYNKQQELLKNNLRKCLICKEILSLDNFYKTEKSKFSYSNVCKQCNPDYRKRPRYDKDTYVCKVCNQELPLTNEYFYPILDSLTGFFTTCRKCESEKHKQKKILNKLMNAYKIPDGYRKCKTCNTILNISEFYNNDECKDGISLRCKICDDKLKKDNYKNKIKPYNNSYVLYDSMMFQELILYEHENRRDPKNNTLGQIKCLYCGRWVNPTIIIVKSRLAAIKGHVTGENRIYCNDNDDICKQSCPIFKMKINSRDSINKYNSREVDSLIRKMCFERDEYRCQKCAKHISEIELHCHHIEGYTHFPILGNDINNVISLCKKCHKQVHTAKGCRYVDYRC